MNYQKYKIIKFINKCPDIGIPKVVIHNALNIDNKILETILQSLINDGLIIILNTKNKDIEPLYHTNFEGYKFIKIYPLLIFKVFWDKYLFSIIISLIFFLLGLAIK